MTQKIFYSTKIFILLFRLKKFSLASNYLYYFSKLENHGGVSLVKFFSFFTRMTTYFLCEFMKAALIFKNLVFF